MTSARDSQKSKVYASEHRLQAAIDMADQTGVRTFEACGSTFEIPVEYKFKSVEDVQHYCDRALATIGFDGPTVKVVNAHANQSKAHHIAGTIALPDRAVESWAWREVVVLHELAHYIAPAGTQHGPDFCGVLIRLVTDIIGPEMGFLLRLTYLENGVKVTEYESP